MLPFRRFKRDAYMLDQCATMVEGTVHEIGEYVNKDEDMTDSMTQTLFHHFLGGDARCFNAGRNRPLLSV